MTLRDQDCPKCGTKVPPGLDAAEIEARLQEALAENQALKTQVRDYQDKAELLERGYLKGGESEEQQRRLKSRLAERETEFHKANMDMAVLKSQLERVLREDEKNAPAHQERRRHEAEYAQIARRIEQLAEEIKQIKDQVAV